MEVDHADVGAVEREIAAASTDVIILSRQTQAPDVCVLRRLIEVMEAVPRAGFAVPIVGYTGMDPCIPGVHFAPDATPCREPSRVALPSPERASFFPAVGGPCLAIRRQAFIDIGGLDPHLESPFAEYDLCLRGWTRGWASLVDSGALIKASHPPDDGEEQQVPPDFRARWENVAARWLFPRARTFSTTAHPTSRARRILVDLSRMSAEGANGGIRVLIVEILSAVRRQRGDGIKYLWLIPAALEAEALAFASLSDEIWLLPAAGRPAGSRGIVHQLAEASEFLAHSLDADLLYAPLGVSDFRTPTIPTIGLVVDLLHRDYPASLPPDDVAQRDRWMRQMCLTDFCIQCISEWTARRVQATFSVSDARIVVTHCAVQSRLRPRAAGHTTPVLFLYPANAWAHKNHEVLLQAYRIYLDRVDGAAWPLVLTGHIDESMQRIRTRIEELGLSSWVKVEGYLRLPQYEALWSQAGALIFPSLHEGFGIPLLEAMHLGVPIVAGRNSSIPEVVGDACLFVDPTNPIDLAVAMARIQSDGILRRQLTETGLTRSKDFHIDTEARKLAHAFSAALAAFDPHDAGAVGARRPRRAPEAPAPASRTRRWLILQRAILRRLHRLLPARRAVPDRTCQTIVHAHVDSPVTWDEPTPTIVVRGWCFAPGSNPIVTIAASIDGRRIGGIYALPRPDVARALNSPAALASGFCVSMPRPPGDLHSVKLLASHRDGAESILHSMELPASPFHVPSTE